MVVTQIRRFEWFSGCMLALVSQSVIRAHDVSPAEIEICGIDSAAIAEFTVSDEGNCSALISATSSDTSVIRVSPDVISAVSHTFRVEAFGVGEATIEVRWAGEGAGCDDVGTFTIPVTVRDATHPRCRGAGELTFEFRPLEGAPTGQFISSLNQRGANVFITHDPTGCECSRVVITQTIKIGDGDWMVDVDPSVTGVDTPFYNYDPATGTGVPNADLGQPGDCSGNTDAELHDVPLQTAEPVEWETCAICCDDGRILDCWSWSYDPTLDRGTEIDGVRQAGLYVDDGRIEDFGAGSRAAYRDRLEEYGMAHPEAASDPCLSNFQMALGDSDAPPNDSTPPLGGSSSGGSMGCVAGGSGAGLDGSWLLLSVLLVQRWRRPRSEHRNEPHAERQ